jgi:hypothetical protein
MWPFKKKVEYSVMTEKEKAIEKVFLALELDGDAFTPLGLHEIITFVIKRILPDYHLKLKPYKRNPKKKAVPAEVGTHC